jgi:hypothetical protein
MNINPTSSNEINNNNNDNSKNADDPSNPAHSRLPLPRSAKSNSRGEDEVDLIGELIMSSRLPALNGDTCGSDPQQHSLESFVATARGDLHLDEHTDGFITQIRSADYDQELHQQQKHPTTATLSDTKDTSNTQLVEDSDYALMDKAPSDQPSKLRLHVEFSERVLTKNIPPTGHEGPIQIPSQLPLTRVIEPKEINLNLRFNTPISQANYDVTPPKPTVTTMTSTNTNTFNHKEPAVVSESSNAHVKLNYFSPDLKTYRTSMNNQNQNEPPPSSNNKPNNNDFVKSSHSHRRRDKDNSFDNLGGISNGLNDGGSGNFDFLMPDLQARRFTSKSVNALNGDADASDGRLPDIYRAGANRFPNRKNFAQRRVYVKFVQNRVEKNHEFTSSIIEHNNRLLERKRREDEERELREREEAFAASRIAQTLGPGDEAGSDVAAVEAAVRKSAGLKSG